MPLRQMRVEIVPVDLSQSWKVRLCASSVILQVTLMRLASLPALFVMLEDMERVKEYAHIAHPELFRMKRK